MSRAPLVNRNHLLAFGGITHYYACAESGIKMVLAHVCGVDLRAFLILAEPYSSMDLRNVTKSIAKARFDDDPMAGRICKIAGDLGTYGPLRNNIAHSRWTNGTRPDAIKPFRVDIRSGSAKFLGKDDDEDEWTSEELIAKGEELYQLNRRVVQLMRDLGVPNMDPSNEETSAETDASEGISRKDS